MQTQHPLREYRAAHELTCAELAKTLGMAEATLRSYENGNRVIPAETAVVIEQRIGVHRSKIRADLWSEQKPNGRSHEHAAD